MSDHEKRVEEIRNDNHGGCHFPDECPGGAYAQVADLCDGCQINILLAAYDAMAEKRWLAHGCIYNSCSSCEFCWGWKSVPTGKRKPYTYKEIKEPQLYAGACDDCKAYYERKFKDG